MQPIPRGTLGNFRELGRIRANRRISGLALGAQGSGSGHWIVARTQSGLSLLLLVPSLSLSLCLSLPLCLSASLSASLLLPFFLSFAFLLVYSSFERSMVSYCATRGFGASGFEAVMEYCARSPQVGIFFVGIFFS